MTLGVTGFVHRRAYPPAFLNAIRRVAAGEAIAIPAAATVERRRPVGALTSREIEVLRHAADGLTSRQIATRIGVTERTVSAHLEKAYRKLGVSSRIAAIEAGRRAGFVR